MKIAVRKVTYMKEKKKIIKQLNCTLTTGITYIVGKNGAGKSSVLKLLTTGIYPDNGEINYSTLISDDLIGKYRKQLSIDEVRTMIGYMPQHFKGHSEMSVIRYLTYIAYHKGIPHKLVKSTVEEWLQKTNLAKYRRHKLSHLSGGQLQKVGLIQALINHPRICILDEPFEGLDMQERLFFKRKIQRLSIHSVVIISTHILEDVEKSDDGSLLYMENGEILFHGGTKELNDIKVRLERN